MDWKTIETAPKDGTQVFLVLRGRPYIGRYILKEQYEYGVLTWRSERWFLDGAYTIDEPHPTHWLPIPTVPQIVQIEEVA